MKKIANPESIREDPVSTRLEVIGKQLMVQILGVQTAFGITRLEIKKLETCRSSFGPSEDVNYKNTMDALQERARKQLRHLWGLRRKSFGIRLSLKLYLIIPESLRLRFKHWMTYDDRAGQAWSPKIP